MSSLTHSSKQEVTIVLSLYLNSRLEQYFPNDPYSDITIIFVSKNYKLQKAYLRLESEYFSESFESESVARNNLLLIGKKFEVGLFEKILRCFYGGKAIIHQSEIYSAFEICQYLKSPSLISQIVEQLVKNFESLNFFMIYSIGFQYSNDELLEKCFTFLRETNFKTMMEEWVYATKPNNKFPNTVYSISEDSFKNLIKMHNQLKANSNRMTGFLSFHDIYNIIKTYVLTNTTKVDQVVKLKEMVVELIDKNQLTSKEYKLIYHQELFLMEDEKNVKTDSSAQKFSKSTDKLDLITSENILFRKEMEELRNDNTVLLGELKVLKENFLKSQSNLSYFEEKYKETLSKFNELKNDVANNHIRTELRFYQMEKSVEELKTELFRQTSEKGNNFYRTSSEKVNGSTKPQQRKSENFNRLIEPLNRKSTEETKASRNERVSEISKEDKMKLLLKNSHDNMDNVKHSLSAESFLIAKRIADLEEKSLTAVPTYSILKHKSQQKPPLAENKIADLIRKFEGGINTLEPAPSPCDKNMNNLMKNIVLDHEMEDQTQESFFFIDKNNNLNNTVLSNYSQIINPSILNPPSNYETNYKNTVLVDISTPFISKATDFKTLIKWFDVKLYQKLKLHLIFRGSRDSFKKAPFKEKTDGVNPIIFFFSTAEFENEVFGGFKSEHSEQGFVFELRKGLRAECSINKEESQELLLSLDKAVVIAEDGNSNQKNFLSQELLGDQTEEKREISFTLKDLEVFQVLIDSEMDI